MRKQMNANGLNFILNEEESNVCSISINSESIVNYVWIGILNDLTVSEDSYFLRDDADCFGNNFSVVANAEDYFDALSDDETIHWISIDGIVHDNMDEAYSQHAIADVSNIKYIVSSDYDCCISFDTMPNLSIFTGMDSVVSYVMTDGFNNEMAFDCN